MSASTDRLASLNAPTERRFYPRVTPSAPIYVAFGPNNLGMLLNVSENGLEVATPNALELNSAYRVFLSLNGAAKAINVSVRTVWTAEAERCSGIQLLDLNEQDREQIRKWVTLQDSQSENLSKNFDDTPRPRLSPKSVETEAKTETWEPAPQAEGAPKKPEFAPMPLPIHGEFSYEPPPNSRKKRHRAFRGGVAVRSGTRSSARAIFWTVCVVAVCLATGWRFRRELAERFLPRQRTEIAKGSSSPTDHSPSAVVPGQPGTTVSANAPPSPKEDAAPSDNAATADKDSGTTSFVPPPSVSQEPSSSHSNIAVSKSPEARLPAPKSDTSASPKYSADVRPRQASGSDAARSVPAPNPPNDFVAPSTVLTDLPASPAESRDAATVAVTTPEPLAGAPPPTTTPNQAKTQARATVPAANPPAANASNANITLPNEPPQRSAIAGSIYDANEPADLPPSNRSRRVVTPVLPQVFARSSTAHSNSYVARGSNSSSLAPSNSAPFRSPVIRMDVQQDRTMQIAVPRGFTASYVELPGERVLRSGAVTMHIQRSVRVPGERIPGQRWLVRGHKTVSLGQLTSRVDPAVSQLPAPNGSITVQAAIDKDGYVTDVRPLYGSFAFAPNVARAIRAWRYEPTYLDNKTVETQAKIEIDFHPLGTRTLKP